MSQSEIEQLAQKLNLLYLSSCMPQIVFGDGKVEIKYEWINPQARIEYERGVEKLQYLIDQQIEQAGKEHLERIKGK